MDLILWRHAEAEVLQDGMDDLSRSLTGKGERQAKRMAQWLDHHVPEGARILVSPARRTEQTALTLGRKYKLRDELSPNADWAEVLQLVKWDLQWGPQGKGTVLLVGHQPWMGRIICALLKMQDSECQVRKGAVWWLRARQRDQDVRTSLVTVACPELVSRSLDGRSL